MDQRRSTKRSRLVHYKRDPLKISIPMGYAVVVSGYIGLYLHPIFSGFSLFMLIINYAMLPGYTFMSYFGHAAPAITFAYIYICVFCCVICSTYCTFTWIVIKNRIVSIILTISTALSIVTLILSIACVKVSQTFWAMTNRNSNWFLDPNFDPNGSWRSSTFTPFQIKDIIRCIIFFVQSILYVIGHQLSANLLFKSLDLQTLS